jgi:hypothetical protein
MPETKETSVLGSCPTLSSQAGSGAIRVGASSQTNGSSLSSERTSFIIQLALVASPPRPLAFAIARLCMGSADDGRLALHVERNEP